MAPRHGEKRNGRWVREQKTELTGQSTTAFEKYCGKCEEWIDTEKEDFLEVGLCCPKCKTRW